MTNKAQLCVVLLSKPTIATCLQAAHIRSVLKLLAELEKLSMHRLNYPTTSLSRIFLLHLPGYQLKPVKGL